HRAAARGEVRRAGAEIGAERRQTAAHEGARREWEVFVGPEAVAVVVISEGSAVGRRGGEERGLARVDQSILIAAVSGLHRGGRFSYPGVGAIGVGLNLGLGGPGAGPVGFLCTEFHARTVHV